MHRASHPLFDAIDADDGQAIEHLVAAHGAGLLAGGQDHEPSPLVYAVDRETPPMQALEACLRLGAECNDALGSRPLAAAITRGHPGCARMLLEHGAHPRAPVGYELPLSAAIARDRVEIADLLIDHGADPNATDFSGEPLLHAAADRSTPEMIRLLVARGAALGAGDDQGKKALSKACGARRADNVAALLDLGIDPNTCERFGETALHAAAAVASTKCLALLLNRGANPNASGFGHRTALHIVARRGREDLVRLLLRHGADPTLVDERGASARQMTHVPDLQSLLETAERHHRLRPASGQPASEDDGASGPSL